jgi:hypothetical protein
LRKCVFRIEIFIIKLGEVKFAGRQFPLLIVHEKKRQAMRAANDWPVFVNLAFVIDQENAFIILAIPEIDGLAFHLFFNGEVLNRQQTVIHAAQITTFFAQHVFFVQSR